MVTTSPDISSTAYYLFVDMATKLIAPKSHIYPFTFYSKTSSNYSIACNKHQNFLAQLLNPAYGPNYKSSTNAF